MIDKNKIHHKSKMFKNNLKIYKNIYGGNKEDFKNNPLNNNINLNNIDNLNNIENDNINSIVNNAIDNYVNDKVSDNNFLAKRTFFQKIKDWWALTRIFFITFLKSDFYFFFKNYLFFIVLFSIIFYMLMKINKTTDNDMVKSETKIILYVVLFFILMIFNDILSTPLESLKIFTLIILLSIALTYYINFFTIYYSKDNNNHKFRIIFWCSIVVYILFLLILYFVIFRNNKKAGNKLFNSFNYAMKNNMFFIIFILVFIYIYQKIYNFLNKNTFITDILNPVVLGGLLIFFLFSFIIFIFLKLKIITKKHILNSYLALFYIVSFLGIIYGYLFMNSLSSVCTVGQGKEKKSNEIATILILLSIFVLLWLDDSRHWMRIGYLLYIIITVFAFYVLFIYSVSHPSVGLLSFWLIIEWLILTLYRTEDSKNSIHYVFMKT